MGSMDARLPLPYGEVLINDWAIQGRFMYPRETITRLLRLARSGALALDAVDISTFAWARSRRRCKPLRTSAGLQSTVLTIE